MLCLISKASFFGSKLACVSSYAFDGTFLAFSWSSPLKVFIL